MAKAKKRKSILDKYRLLSNKRKGLVIAAALLGLLLVYGFIQITLDWRRMSIVKSDLNQAMIALREAGFDVKEYEGCWRAQAKYGTGAKVCETELIAMEAFDDIYDTNEKKEAWANERQDKFLSAIAKLETFENRGEVWPVNILGTGGGRYSGHIKTKVSCGAGTDYNEHSASLRLRLGCITTSWFARTFQNGQFFL